MSVSQNVYSKKYKLVCFDCKKPFDSCRPKTKCCSVKCRANAWYNAQSEKYKKEKNGKNVSYDRKKNELRKIEGIGHLGGKCSVCGYNKCTRALEFHHIKPHTKDKSIHKLTKLSHKRFMAEISKCVLLCANCHREHHSTHRKLKFRKSKNRSSLTARKTVLERNRYKRYKLKAVQIKGGQCVECAYKKDICSLDFHHTGDKTKMIKELLHGSWEKIELELTKCELLCANCHREKHFKELNE
jgi:5-methylcytosine-specific restriction endonuclease McrA